MVHGTIGFDPQPNCPNKPPIWSGVCQREQTRHISPGTGTGHIDSAHPQHPEPQVFGEGPGRIDLLAPGIGQKGLKVGFQGQRSPCWGMLRKRINLRTCGLSLFKPTERPPPEKTKTWGQATPPFHQHDGARHRVTQPLRVQDSAGECAIQPSMVHTTCLNNIRSIPL